MERFPGLADRYRKSEIIRDVVADALQKLQRQRQMQRF
jgi:hypothetical protein